MVSISEDISRKSIVQAITIAHSPHYLHPLKEAVEAPLMAPSESIPIMTPQEPYRKAYAFP